MPTTGSERAAGWPLASTTRVRSAWAASPLWSVTRTVKEDVAAAEGVPVTAPVVGSRLRPAGSAPEVTDHVNGAPPPEAASDAAYGWRWTAGSNEAVVTVSDGVSGPVAATQAAPNWARVGPPGSLPAAAATSWDSPIHCMMKKWSDTARRMHSCMVARVSLPPFSPPSSTGVSATRDAR